MSCEAFIVHLARATGRAAAVQAAAAAVGMPCTVVDAVDGQRLSQTELDAAYVPNGLHAPRYPFVWGRGEIACFLSHRKVWAEIVARGLDWGWCWKMTWLPIRRSLRGPLPPCGRGA